MTTVVNLFGAPGSGKSTTAAGLFYHLKLEHKHCEMVREYVKNWSWEDRKPGIYDQMYILGKQAKYESLLYGKVDYIITDSPIILSGFYENHNAQGTIAVNAAKEFMQRAEANGVKYVNFWLESHDHYDSRGRYQNKEDALALGPAMHDWLVNNGVELNVVIREGEDRVWSIYDTLLPETKCSGCDEASATLDN